MIVCSCKGVRDTQIRALRQSGSDNAVVRLGDAVRALGLGTGCGRCLRHARRLMDEDGSEAPAAVLGGRGWRLRGADALGQTA